MAQYKHSLHAEVQLFKASSSSAAACSNSSRCRPLVTSYTGRVSLIPTPPFSSHLSLPLSPLLTAAGTSTVCTIVAHQSFIHVRSHVQLSRRSPLPPTMHCSTARLQSMHVAVLFILTVTIRPLQNATSLYFAHRLRIFPVISRSCLMIILLPYCRSFVTWWSENKPRNN